MATKVVLDVGASGVRLTLWLLLLIVVFFDFCLHRNIRTHGWKLSRGLVILLGLNFWKEMWQLAFSANQGSVGLLGMYVVTADISDSWFLALCLHIACGYSITRETLGHYKSKALGLPIVYCLLILIVDIIILSETPSAFYTYERYDNNSTSFEPDSYDPEDGHFYYKDNKGRLADEEPTSAGKALIAVLAAVASLFCWIVGIMFIFEFVKMECMALEEALLRAEKEQADAAAASANGQAPIVNDSFEGLGDPDNAAEGDAHQNPETRHDITHEIKTVEDAIAHRDKSRLLKRFRVGAYAYAIAYAMVIILPGFFPVGLVPQTLQLIYNFVYWGFCIWLAWTFRIRQNNPYLLLGDDGQVGGAALDMAQLDTELGVKLGVVAPADKGKAAEETMGTRLVVHTQEQQQQQPPPRKQQAASNLADVSNFTLTEDDEWDVRPPEIVADPNTGPGTPSAQIKPNALNMWPKRNAAPKAD